MALSQEIINELKSWDWQSLIEYGNGLDPFNEAQWRFFKGFVIESAIAAESTLEYVAAPHKDYDWPKYGLSVELKSLLAGNVYTEKQGLPKSTHTVKFNNSNGTNKEGPINEDHVADILLVVARDGAFVVDKETVLPYLKYQGDGYSFKAPESAITRITDRVIPQFTYENTLKEQIEELVKQDYLRFKNSKLKVAA